MSLQQLTSKVAAIALTLGSVGFLPAKATSSEPHQLAQIPDRSYSLEQQATTLYQQGHYDDAALLFQQVLEIRRASLGDRHPEVATVLNNLALLYHEQGHYEEAKPYYLEALEIFQEHFGSLHPNVAINLNNLAALYQDQGRYEEAESYYLQSLDIRKELLGNRHPDIATNLNNLASLYQEQGRYEEAEAYYLRALEIFQEQFGNRHPHVAANLDNLAGLYYRQGRYEEAESYFLQALELLEGLEEPAGVRNSYIATSLNNLALLYKDQWRYEEAEVYYLRALGIFQELLGDSHPNVATSLDNVAVLYHIQGRYEEAEAFYLQGLEIRRSAFNERHPNIANSLNNLAGLYQEQGRYEAAESYYLQALSIRQEQLGDLHPLLANSLSNLAGLYQEQGRYGEAEAYHLQVLDILQELLGNHHPNVAIGLNNLATLYESQGRYAEAEPYHLQALKIFQEKFGNRHPLTAMGFNNLALLYHVQRRYEEAESYHLQALDIRQEVLGDFHPDVAASLNNLAGLYQDQGRYGEAEPYYLQALKIFQEHLDNRHPTIATNLNNLALLFQDQGRYEEAESYYLQSFEIRQEQLGDRHPALADSLNNLSLLYQRQGHVTETLRYLQQALDIEEWNLGLNLATLAETQRQDYAATITVTTNRALSLSFEAGDEVQFRQPLALKTVLQRKGRLLDAGTVHLQRFRQILPPADQPLMDDLIATRQTLATLVFNPPDNLPSDQYHARLQDLEKQANDLESALARRNSAFRIESQPLDISSVQAQLPSDGVLVEYIRYYPFDAEADRGNQWGEGRYAAYLLFPDGRVEAIDLGKADPIDTAIQSFTALLQDRRTTFRSANTAEIGVVVRDDIIETTTDTLRTLLFDPIAPHLTDIDHLLISPDSQLNRLPFEAIQLEPGGDYLIQRYQISYLNSGRDLLKFDITEPSTNPAVILANPNYDIADATVVSSSASQIPASEKALGARSTNRHSNDLGHLQVTPLPGTQAEVEAIQPLLPDATILTGDRATENALKTVQSPSILHIATHGFFLSDITRPVSEISEGLLASTTPTPDISITENPLLRSGLTLAGFNPRSSGSEDGAFTALEASNLNLSGTQLVVLSACDTGLGDIANGEGVYGLRRAFALAGAESQLISLWQVSDDGTQSLMAQYYENLTDGMGRSEALQAVQLEMISQGDEYSHPYYWAAFILTGDWQPLAEF